MMPLLFCALVSIKRHFDDSWNTQMKNISFFIPVSLYSFVCAVHTSTHQTTALPSSPSISLCFVPSICAKASPSTESLKRHLEKAWLGSLGRETNQEFTTSNGASPRQPLLLCQGFASLALRQPVRGVLISRSSNLKSSGVIKKDGMATFIISLSFDYGFVAISDTVQLVSQKKKKYS